MWANIPRLWSEVVDHGGAGECGKGWKGMTRAGKEREMNRHERTQAEFGIRRFMGHGDEKKKRTHCVIT